MRNYQDIMNDMLKADGIVSAGISDDDRQALQQIIAKERKRVQRTKWGMATSWVLFVIFFAVGAAGEVFKIKVLEDIMTVGSILFYIIAIVFTIGFLVRTFIYREREQRIWMARVESRLSQLEETPPRT